MDKEIIDVDEKDAIYHSSKNVRLVIDAVKKFIDIKKSIICILIGQAKKTYDEILSEHVTFTKNVKFSTNLYAMAIFGKDPKEGIISDINVLPGLVSDLQYNLCSRGIHLPATIYDTIIDRVNNIPGNCICFVGIDAPGIIIWYCPIIDPNKNLSNIQIETYVLLYEQTIRLYKSKISIDYKTASNDQITIMCTFCHKSPTNIVHCSSCNMIYCSIDCLRMHADNHKSFCKNLQDLQSNKQFLDKICAHCKKYNKSAKLCTGCFTVRYCDSKCQLRDWKIHKLTCNKLTT